MLQEVLEQLMNTVARLKGSRTGEATKATEARKY